MIRFIDIRDQGTGYSFAFWDTCLDKFCTINGYQAFDDIDDLKETFSLGSEFLETYSFERFERICASYAFEKARDDKFYSIPDDFPSWLLHYCRDHKLE